MLFPFVMALTLTTMAHCDAVGRDIHATNKAVLKAKQSSQKRTALAVMR
jgi:hypothetical protein